MNKQKQSLGVKLGIRVRLKVDSEDEERVFERLHEIEIEFN